MRALFIFVLIVGTVSANWHAWKPGTQYKYELRGRTLAGLYQVSNQFSGILLKGEVTVQPYGDNILSVRVSQPQYADIHANLSSGWSTHIADNTLSYKPLPLTNKPFELKLKNGVVDKMIIDKSLPTWEINMLKGIASQLQVDTQAQNLKKSRINQLPSDKNQPMGVFKTMEDSVTGECETLYDISPLPDYVLQSKPMLAPLLHLQGDGQIIEIVKTMNYSNCHQRMAYNFGITGFTNWKPAASQMGNMLSRATTQYVIVSGNLNLYTVQSSVTINKVIIAPHLHNTQKGIVVSMMNLTISALSSTSATHQPLSNPRVLNNLVYDYNEASDGDTHHSKFDATSSSSSSSSGSDSQSSSSSSNESHLDSKSPQSNGKIDNQSQEQKKIKRLRRSMNEPSNFSEKPNASSKVKPPNSSRIESSSSSSESGSMDEGLQIKPSLTMPPNTPFLPEFIGQEGNSVQSSQKINISLDVIKKLVQKIAYEIQQPNLITGEHTLTSFNLLTELIRTMTDSQIEEIGDHLYFSKNQADPKSSADNHKYITWVIFRDAVAETGTGPALITIKSWVLKMKVKGEEAAQLLSVLPKTARFPTEDYMKELFALVTSSTVRDQLYLNSSAIHCFTDLMSMVQSKQEQHNRFPVHSFGKFIKNKALNHFSNKYLLYLSKQLNNSVLHGDSHKIQVYIHALGNSAHPKILHILEPYLEGKEPITMFQRLFIVASLDRMTQIHPNIVRSVLYKIYLNTREAPELRVAAVMQLMKTNPPAEMLQRMAQYTNSEHSKQVNSAVKSAIEAAAQLKGPHNMQLMMNARSAVDLLTPRQYGPQYSKIYLKNFIREHEIYPLSLTSIQSKDSVFPSSLFFNFGKQVCGFAHLDQRLTVMTSSADEVMNLLSDQFAEYEGPQQNSADNQPKSGTQWTVKNISNMIKLSLEETDQVEGNIRISWAGIDRLITFDNSTLEQLPSLVYQAVVAVKRGADFNYTKLLNQHTIKIGFPTDMGLPFVYSLQVPTLMSMGGEAQVITHPDLSNGPTDQVKLPQTANITADIKMTYASKTQAKLGFVTPFSHQHYLTGYDSGMFINLPLRIKIDIDTENAKLGAKLQPLNANTHQKIVEYSTLAYTTKHNVIDLLPPQINKNSEIVHIGPIQKFEITAGQQNTGFAFDIKAETEQKYFDYANFMKEVKMNNLLSAILHYNKHQTIKPNTNYSLAFNPQKTSAAFAKIVVNYGENSKLAEMESSVYNHQNGAIPSNTSPNSQMRVQQFLSRVSSGIQDANAQALDVSLEFNGETNSQYIATAAYGRSYASQESRVLVFLSKDPAKTTSENRPYQIAMDLLARSPKVPLNNFRQAMEADPTLSISSIIHFGEKAESGGHIKFKSEMTQSREYREHLKNTPLANECTKQMSIGNYILPACRNVTARANLLDDYSLIVEYDGVPDVFKNLTYKAYSAIREKAYAHVSENIMTQGNRKKQINISTKFSPDLASANISIDTSLGNIAFTDLRIGQYAKALTVVHAEYNAAQRLGQITMRSQQYPTCAIDKSFATTFDNKTYSIQLGKCWHVMVHSTPHTPTGLTNEDLPAKNSASFSILVRDIAASQREVMLVLDENIVTLLPKDGSVADYYLVNGQKQSISNEPITQSTDKERNPVVNAYKLPSGSLRIFIPKYGFEIIYDGLRVKFQLPNIYRNKVRGLCGNFDGEKSTDFTTPQNCILRNPLEFASSFAVIDQSCEEPAIHEQHQSALKAVCLNNTVLPGDVISDLDASSRSGRDSNQKKSGKLLNWVWSNKVKHQKGKDTCGVYATLIIHRGGFKCFSKTPQLQCLGSCRMPVSRTPKALEFSCLPERDGGIIHSLATIPEILKSNLVSKVESVWVPLQCI